MTAQELRIGNWVLMGEEYRQIRQDDFEMFNYIESTFDPIPITTEILLAAGFERSRSHQLDYFKKVKGQLKPFCFRISRPFIHNDSYYPEKKFLHELQNVFYFITGEELLIEL